MLTENFVNEGFTLRGLRVNFHGNDKPVMVYEFPIYNFVVGLFFRIFGPSAFFGKLVSLVCSGIGLLYLFRLVNNKFGERIAVWTCGFFILSPVSRVLTTAFQPDAFGLMWVLIACAKLDAWREHRRLLDLSIMSVALLLCGLAKFPLLVPYIPLFFAGLAFEGRTIHWPKAKEIALFLGLFVMPFLAWSAYRRTLIDPLFPSDGELTHMFLVGDLRRFFSAAYYLKAGMRLFALILSGVGFVFFCFGLRRLSRLEISLLSGIPLYYVLIPTVGVQWYYLFACLPILALFMAKGLVELIRICHARRISFVVWGLGALYIAVFAVGTQYALRPDRVSYAAARALRETTGKDDLVFSILMHDRGNPFGDDNPTMFYLSQRRGWNFRGSDIPDSVVPQIESLRSKGLRCVVATRFTPDLELWCTKFIPAQMRRNPRVDSDEVFRRLQERYRTAALTENYIILDIRD